MIHYHGTPITPRSKLLTMHGKHFCVSFAAPWDILPCLEMGQSVLMDNGAFSVWRRGIKTPNWTKYYAWCESKLNHPHWAIVPDVIDGSEPDNDSLLAQWPFPRRMAGGVWHTNESMERLLRLAESGFGYLCFGSTAAFRPGADAWNRRMDEAFSTLEKRGLRPWVHMLRGLSQAGKRWPFASADSTNVARNYKRNKVEPRDMADAIDRIQCPIFYQPPHDNTDISRLRIPSPASSSDEAWGGFPSPLALLHSEIVVHGQT